MADSLTSDPRPCFWPKCSDRKRCDAHGSCVAKAQAGGATFEQPTSNPRDVLALLREVPRGTSAAIYPYDGTHLMVGRICMDAVAEIERLRDDLERARYAPMGDNHHNAMACPHCNPRPATRTCSVANDPVEAIEPPPPLPVLLENVARWLEQGCEVKYAIQELRMMARAASKTASETPARLEPHQCTCETLSVRGTPGDLEVYCDKCGRVFRTADKTAGDQ